MKIFLLALLALFMMAFGRSRSCQQEITAEIEGTVNVFKEKTVHILKKGYHQLQDYWQSP